MTIRHVTELGAAVRAERMSRGLTQTAVAQLAGVSREWLGRLERGAPRLEADKVLRALDALDIRVVPKGERATQQDIARALKIAWTMSLEAQAVTDEGFNKVLDKVVAHRLARVSR